MTVPPTESGEGDPGQVTRIAEEFIRLHEAGQLTDLDEFCARYPEDQRENVRQECEQLLRIQGVIKQHDRLMPGQTLGSYEIVEAIGKGGMGEVYRARDLELDRDIAVKVLPTELACQPERVKRFKREAKAIAALDHPNIVTIHSVEESDGLHFITMQLVQGKTLSELIPKKGLALEKFFDVAIPLADAISSAHEQGITHRDLKPANIMVTADGRVEILDFGLAKLRPQVAAEAPTQLPQSSLTVEGQIVGTVAYMSPEQAEGKHVDHRSDIFSLGIILYEMVTGERPFKGDTKLSVMTSIMRDTPTSVTELNAALPRHLGRIARRCLAKDVEQRYQTAKDIRNELTELRTEIDSGETVAPVQMSGRRWLWPTVSTALLAALVLVLLVPEFVLGGGSGPIVVDTQQLTDLAGSQSWPSLSPDGDEFLYNDNTSGNQDIYRQRVGGVRRNLTEDNTTGDVNAVFSPDGERIAFRSGRQGRGIFVMGADENPVLIVGDGFQPSWSPEGESLVYSTVNVGNPYARDNEYGELWVVDVNTRVPKELYTKGQVDAFHPSWSPSGDRIAFAGATGAQRDIWTIPADGGDPSRVTEDVDTDWGPFWSPDGKYLYFLSDRGTTRKPDLWRVRIDEDSGEPQSDPEEVYSFDNGRIIWATISGGNIVCTVELVNSVIERFGFNPDAEELIAGEREVIYSTNNYVLRFLTLSPNDEWLTYTTFQGVEDVFVLRPDGSRLPRNLTNDLYKYRYLTWYPATDNGLWLSFASNRDGTDYQIWAVPLDGPGLPRQLTEGPLTNYPRWWPDGRRLGAWRQDIPGVDTKVVFEFPDGLLGGTSRPGQPRFEVDRSGSWSRDNHLIAHTQDGAFRVVSEDPSFDPQIVRDEDEEPYRVVNQWGNRWLDDHRFIFWDNGERKAFLWNVKTQDASEIDGVPGSGEFVFSKNGDALFRLSRNRTTEIWLLELSK